MNDKESHGLFKYRFASYEPSRVTFYSREGEVLLQEPSLLAVNTETGVVLALGEEAAEARGMEAVIVGSPLRRGAVAEFEFARMLFRFFFQKADVKKRFFKPKAALCIPKDSTQVERRAFSELLYSIGVKAGGLLIIEEPFEKAVSLIPDTHKIIIDISFSEQRL